MIGTFVRLTVWSLRNRIRARLRRLRQPRYLVGMVLGVAYFYGVVFRHQIHAAKNGQHFLRADQLAVWGPDIAIVGGVLLWVVALLTWIASAGHTWRFTPAEVQFLYTAPVSRRDLLHYKLLRGQVGALVGVFATAFFSGALLAGSVSRWAFLLGGWIAFGTIALHLSGIHLAKTRLRSASSRRAWQAWVPPVTMAALSVAFLADSTVRVLTLPPGSLKGTLQPVLDIAGSGASGLAMWPFRTLVQPLVASTWRDLSRTLVPALGIIALNYAWVLSGDRAAAHATLTIEQKQARTATRRAAVVVRARPFELRATGRPEVAIAWKNLILLSRYASLRTVVRILPVIVVLAALAGRGMGALAVSIVALALGGYTVLFGPMSVRNDLRHDLPRLAVLRSWPVSGASILAGELAAPAAVLTAVTWSSIVVALAASSGAAGPLEGWLARVVAALAAAVLAPALIVGQLVVQNAGVVLFPGWIATGDERPRGIEAAGQNIVVLVGTMLAFTLGLLPALLVGAAVGWLLFFVVGIVAAVPAALAATAALGVESAVAVWLLGRVLDRTEPGHVESNR